MPLTGMLTTPDIMKARPRLRPNLRGRDQGRGQKYEMVHVNDTCNLSRQLIFMTEND